jgi:DNA-nicking Smr family endonuclease
VGPPGLGDPFLARTDQLPLGIEIEPSGQVNRARGHLDPFWWNQTRHDPTTLPHARVHPRGGRHAVIGNRRVRPEPVKLKLDLHDIYNRGGDIDRALRSVIEEAIEKKAPLVEIIPGKGSGQLKKRVLRFLDQKEVKALYDRVEKDSHNFGRVFVHFRWK